MYLSIIKAAQIAKHELSSCVTDDGIIAGRHHFVDLWARDGLFASFGSNPKTAKRTIETFLQYQREDGLIPYRILRSAPTFTKYFGKPEYLPNPVPNFRSHQSGGIVPDGGLMTIIAISEYEKRTGDNSFRKKYGRELNRSINWYINKFKGDLTREWFQCEWSDAVLKSGSTLYTNILYWKALGDMGMSDKQNNLANLIRKHFWNGIYFADWVDWKRQDYFASLPNMFAIIWGFATKKQATSILSYANTYCWNGWTLETNYPRYPIWRIPIQNYIVGIADYQNRGCLWLQPGILYAVALHKNGRIRQSQRILNAIAKKIVEYDGVYEVYERSGAPVKRFFYRAEQPFAWSSGLYLWASEIIFGK